MATKEARARATAKYEAANYDKILVRLPKGKKKEITDTGETVNGFINRAVDDRLEALKDGSK